MFDCLQNYLNKAAIRAACASFLACCGAGGQDFTIGSANSNPFGVNGPLPFGKPVFSTDGKGFKGGIGSAVGIQSTYDSNFFLEENNPESEFSIDITPSISYSTDPEGGARVQIAAGYTPTATVYLQNTDLNGVDQSGNISLTISGSRTVISAFAGFVQQSGTDRFAGGFITGSELSFGLSGSYQLAPRTSVFANWAPSIVDYEGSSVVGFSDYSASVGGSWAATELFSFGPSLSYSTSNSDNTGTLDSWGFSFQANYKAAERLQLAGSFGLQNTQYSRDTESGSFNFTGSLNASYQIDERWSWSSSIQSGIVPSPTQTNYVINSWSISSKVSRSLLTGSIGLGLDMVFSNFDQVGVGGTSQDSDQNIATILTYTRPFFSDRVGLNTSIRYTLNNGQNEWSQIQLSAGLSMGF